MNHENFANVLQKGLNVVVKAAELLQKGPQTVGREKNHVFVGWDLGGLKQSVVLEFKPEGHDGVGVGDHISPELHPDERKRVDTAMSELFDWIAIGEQTSQLQ